MTPSALVGHPTFYHRLFGLEKLFRDVQGCYHPTHPETQRKLAGQLALGCDLTLL